MDKTELIFHLVFAFKEVEEEESTTYEKLTELINRYDTKNKLEELNHGI